MVLIRALKSTRRYPSLFLLKRCFLRPWMKRQAVGHLLVRSGIYLAIQLIELYPAFPYMQYLLSESYRFRNSMEEAPPWVRRALVLRIKSWIFSSRRMEDFFRHTSHFGTEKTTTAIVNRQFLLRKFCSFSSELGLQPPSIILLRRAVLSSLLDYNLP